MLDEEGNEVVDTEANQPPSVEDMSSDEFVSHVAELDSKEPADGDVATTEATTPAEADTGSESLEDQIAKGFNPDGNSEDKASDQYTDTKEETTTQEPAEVVQDGEGDGLTEDVAKALGMSLDELRAMTDDPLSTFSVARDRKAISDQQAELEKTQQAFFNKVTTDPWAFLRMLNQDRVTRGQAELTPPPDLMQRWGAQPNGVQPAQQPEVGETETDGWDVDPQYAKLQGQMSELQKKLDGFTSERQKAEEQQQQMYVQQQITQARSERESIFREELAKAIKDDQSALPFAQTLAERASYRLLMAENTNAAPGLLEEPEPVHRDFAKKIIASVIGSHRKQIHGAGRSSSASHEQSKKALPGIGSADGGTLPPTNPNQQDVGSMTTDEFLSAVSAVESEQSSGRPGLI